MSLPEGYFVNNDHRVCKLKKSLYGLKQAPRKWNEKLTSVLNEFDFKQSKNDHSLFIKSDNDNMVILLVYVDDIIITGNNVDEINKFKNLLSSKFLIKDLGELKYFLGIEVIKHDNGLSFSQRKYCLELLNEFGMLGCKPASTPIEVSQTKVNGKILAKDDYPLVSFGNFQKLVGKLIYLTMTRPDISYAVHKLSQAMHGPLNSDLKLAFRVLRYLKGAPGKGVFYKKSDNFALSAFVDSDWAKCTATRRSVTGFAVFLGSSLVSWKSKKQSVLAKSSAEAEYRAMSNVACEIIWILKLLTDLKVDYTIPVNMFCDSSAAMQIAANPVFHERTKHFEIDLYFLREKIADGVFKTCKIDSEFNAADVLTKGLSAADHKRMCDLLKLVDVFQA
ncbi:putative RNA-directed DNA polymerase [Tanacetum coccineum]